VPSQLDYGGEFPVLKIGLADRFGGLLIDNEHGLNMGTCVRRGNYAEQAAQLQQTWLCRAIVPDART
jgi:hypothetical protein